MTEDLRIFYLRCLATIIHECGHIIAFTKDLDQDYNKFSSDIKSNRAIRCCLEIIGETFSRITYKESGKKIDYTQKALISISEPIKFSDHLSTFLPEYSKFNEFKNSIKHNYDTVDEELIWSLAVQHTPILLDKAKKILHKLGKEKEF